MLVPISSTAYRKNAAQSQQTGFSKILGHDCEELSGVRDLCVVSVSFTVASCGYVCVYSLHFTVVVPDSESMCHFQVLLAVFRFMAHLQASLLDYIVAVISSKP